MLRGLKQTLYTRGPRNPIETETELCLSVPWEVWVSSGWLQGQGALGALDPGLACSLLEEVAINPIIQKDPVIRK